MARFTSGRRPWSHRLILFLTVLLLVAAGCSNDSSVFTTGPGGTTPGTVPGGTGTTGITGTTGGTTTPGDGSNPGGSAEAIPAGAQAYAGFDLTALPALMRLVTAFGSADPAAIGEGLDLGEGAGQAVEGLGEARDLLGCLGRGLGLDPASLPAWLGDEAAVALFGMQVDESGDFTDPNALVAVAVADRPGAEAFLQQLIGVAEGCMSATFAPVDYKGVTVYRADRPGEQPVAFALTQDYLLVGMGEGMVARAIDLADGVSLAQDANFAEVVAALPNGRHVTGYMGMDLPQQMLESLAGELSGASPLPVPSGLDPAQALAGMRGFGMAATMLAEGVRVDLVALGSLGDSLPAMEQAASPLPARLPSDALGYLGIGPFDVAGAWDALKQLLAQMPAEPGQPNLEDSLTLIGTMLGIDIEQDLVRQLTGEVGLALLPATQGSLAEQAGVNLGLLAVMGVKDPGAMANTAEKLAGGIGQLGGTPATPRPYEGGTLYALSDGSTDIALFGMAGNDMVITTHQSHAAALLAGGDKLAGSARYTAAIGGLLPGSLPLMYLDIAALVAALDVEEDEAAAVAPLQTVAVGLAGAGEAGTITVYARIDY
ncbi:MAG: DUF3352 domain-containing protein [Actinobacteria bacterium]|nr:DUF3352 domain-containing protein [Actinomycetota bacterium]